MRDWQDRRAAMVEQQIAGRGLADPRVLDAMRAVPREAFVPTDLQDYAYDDTPLPIGHDQTISQPFIVAAMIDALALNPDDRVLEIGAGSGYAAAVIGQIASEVIAVERHAALADAARERIERLGYDNVVIVHGDGSQGWPGAAPYDAITVAAAGPRVPESLRAQLAPGGRLVIPVGPSPDRQRLVRVVRKTADRFDEQQLDAVRFVPLVGREGWPEQPGAQAGPGAATAGFAAAASPAASPAEIVATGCVRASRRR